MEHSDYDSKHGIKWSNKYNGVMDEDNNYIGINNLIWKIAMRVDAYKKINFIKFLSLYKFKKIEMLKFFK